MELKEYQQNTLKRVKAYLEALKNWRVKNDKVVALAGKEMSADVPLKAWEEIGGKNYRSRKNGIGESLPNFCLKIPTGGGKTLLAAHTVDLVNRSYRQKQTGLVLWVMPTTQIYRQTIEHLRNRDHSYRQVLDIASGGRTVIYEKTDRFTPEDVAENLVVLTLMLPSASRQNKETLKVFKDSGGFSAFFPKDDDVQGHAKLLERFPNLDAFGDGKGLFQRQVKTSLGNTLRILSPIIILDEGHKGKPHTLNVILPILFILSGVPMSAQTDGGGGGFSQPATPEAEAQWRQEAQMRFSQAAKIQHSRGRPFRVVDNKIYNVQTSLLWSVISGAVYEKDGDVVIVKASFGSFPYIAVKNYTGEAMASRPVSTLAMPAGIYDMDGSPIELYDCGILPTPEQMQQVRDEQDKALALVEQQKAAAQKAAEAKAYASQTSAVRWLQSQAAGGSASAQCSLGLHYLTGQGCETNQTLAVFWLQKAAAQGDIEASNKLAQIQIP